MPGIDEYFDEAADEGGSSESDVAAGEAQAPTLDRRALLQSLIDANEGSDLGQLAAAALSNLVEREAAQARAESLLAVSAELTEESYAQAVAEFERQKVAQAELGEGALNSPEFAEAQSVFETMRAAMRAEVEAERAQALQAQLDSIYAQTLADGYGEEFARAAAREYADQAASLLGSDMETEADLLLSHPIYRGFETAQYYRRREIETLRNMQLERPGYSESLAADLSAEQAQDVDVRLAELTGG